MCDITHISDPTQETVSKMHAAVQTFGGVCGEHSQMEIAYR